MHRTFAIISLFSVAGALHAQQPALQAAPSTRANAVVSLEGPEGSNLTGRIAIDYGQPHLRGRTLHTGGLVPLDSVWRFGANAATTLETDVDLVIGGLHVPKGKYALFALPGSGGWKLIVNRNTGQFGRGYMAEHDLGRVDLLRRTLAAPVESFSIWLIPAREAGTPRGELRFAWGNVELSTNWALHAH